MQQTVRLAEREVPRALQNARLSARQSQRQVYDALDIAHQSGVELSLEASIAVEHLRMAIASIDRAAEGVEG